MFWHFPNLHGRQLEHLFPLLTSSILSSRTDASIPTADAAAPVSRDGARYMSSKLLLSSELRRSVRILKRILRASRHLAASKLACILDEVSVKNDFTSWARLFQFSHRCFAIPTRGSRRRSLATLVNRQLQDKSIPSTLKHPRPGSRPSSDPLRTLAKRVSSKLEEGDYRGAVRTACSEDSVAVVTEEVISELKRKHPPSHTDSHIILQPDQSISSATVSEEEICQAIRSFPNGSSGGPVISRSQTVTLAVTVWTTAIERSVRSSPEVGWAISASGTAKGMNSLHTGHA